MDEQSESSVKQRVGAGTVQEMGEQPADTAERSVEKADQPVPEESYSFQSSHLKDSGNLADEYYKARLSPLRYWIRQLCIPIVDRESVFLAELQKRIRTPFWDVYFAWTANLASHTFYVLMLPVPLWFGTSSLSRDLVYVLGLGIYISGNLKDYLCLPRPRSPPLYRITMSSYTTKEYGCPSSHSANATAATLVFLGKVYEYRDVFSAPAKFTMVTFLMIYYFSLIFGRIYCGMHGFLDIVSGSLIGVGLFLFRFLYGSQWDNWLLDSHNDSVLGLVLTPVMIVAFYVFLIHIHVEPVDDCPCFDDSVAFVGVLIGLDLSHWITCATRYLARKYHQQDPMMIPFSMPTFKLAIIVLRLAVGVVLVVIWKAISKPVLFTILPPIYKYIGVYLPRKSFLPTANSSVSNRQIRSQSLSNMHQDHGISELHDLMNAFKDHERKHKDHTQQELHDKDDPHKHIPKSSGVFKSRYDVEIVGRLIVYAGISTTAVWGFTFGAQLVGLI